ncbi:MAG: DUF2961 domain-containing protein, partial [Planctomycetes bacterium]|nr:DUF2961 domain-containing protein [Planctomycetota bacterium]
MPASTVALLHKTMTLALLCAAATAQATVDFASLVREARDLRALARAPKSLYRVVQWSSGGANRGIEAVLQQPDARGNGEYLLGEVSGSGAIVATWTNGMDGRIRMIVDGDILWDGEAETFLRRRSAAFLAMSGAEDDASHPVHAFTQGDWDFLPVPFARSLRIEWSGDARREPAFRIALRHWLDGTWVNPFRFEDLRGAGEELARTARELRDPELGEIPDSRRELSDVVALAPTGEVSLDHAVATGSRGDAISVLRVRIEEPSGEARARVLHGVVLRIGFDGAERPQVEAPLAGFFGTAAGSGAFAAQPIAVQADGWMVCRFPMPYHTSARITFADHSGVPSRIACERAVDAMDVDLDTLQFRARWRVERGLEFEADGDGLELPLLVMRGSGRLVGHAVSIVNPSGSITPSDNAWLCGDETLLLDRDPDPALRGPGSAAARAFLGETLDRPWVGCPLASGPCGTGLVLHHRFRILDAVPFQSFVGSWVALRSARALAGVEHASISYVYARPGAVAD